MTLFRYLYQLFSLFIIIFELQVKLPRQYIAFYILAYNWVRSRTDLVQSQLHMYRGTILDLCAANPTQLSQCCPIYPHQELTSRFVTYTKKKKIWPL